MFSLLIKNALVIDGTGKKPELLDVAVENDTIVAVKPQITSQAHSMYDAKGMVLSPGFIDIQNHSDTYWQLFDNPSLDSLVTQGYTTAIVGNSGASLAPLISSQSILSVQKWQSTMGLNINWRSFSEYRESLKSMKFGTNVGSLVGYSTVRRGLLGDRLTPPSYEELQVLVTILSESLQSGALGVSVGLLYSHELNVTNTELAALAELCASKNKILAVSLRSEADGLIDSLRELAALAEQTGVKLKISHFKIRYKNNWPHVAEALQILEGAWHRGASIHFDTTPYTESWQPLYTYLPSWALEGGRTHLLERLKNPDDRKKIESAIINHPAEIGELIIASTAHGLKVTGKTIGSVAKGMGITSEAAVLNLIEHGGTNTLVFDTCLNPETVNDLCNHALSFIATNGGGFPLLHEDRLVHPRCFGTAPTFLRKVIDENRISLPEAIRKLTTAPAEKLNLHNRGKIATDYFADMVLFDPATINSNASIQNPYQISNGINSVWVNGVQTAVQGSITTNLSGIFLE